MTVFRDITFLAAGQASERCHSATEGAPMRTFPRHWILFLALFGAYTASKGYDPESDPEMAYTPVHQFGSMGCFLAVAGAVMTLLIPVVNRVNEGRWDWRKAKTDATLFALGWATMVALLLAAFGVYRFVVGMSGGWVGGWRDIAVGALIGTALGLSARFLLDGLRIAERLGVPDPRAEPAAAPDIGRD